MNKVWKERWVKALRSGKYKQGKGHLHANGKYCCLGVLRQIVTPGSLIESENGDLLPNFLLQKVCLHHETQDRLADMNDTGWTFESIANYIEKRL